MPALRFGGGDLLEYNPTYSLLICRECKYAIQKRALESHLLRHKIYRGDRQRLLSSITGLDLLEPHCVPLPAPGSPPVDSLPVLSGYCCTAAGCRHLTASAKRMRRHWSAAHGLAGSALFISSFARPVKLQTFFRGTEIRYFEVSSPTVSDNYGDDGDKGDEGDEEEDRHGITVVPPPSDSSPQPSPRGVPSPYTSAINPSLADFNLDTLTYFHHFFTITSPTLPGAEGSQSTECYWQVHVVPLALQRRWLMCGLLAIAAHHLAILTDDPTTKCIHRDHEARLSSEFSARLAQMTMYNEIEETTKKAGEQIRCLLCCAQWALFEPMLDCRSVSPSELPSIISTIRGCIVPDATVPSSSVQIDGSAGQKESFIPGFLQMRNPSYSRNPGTTFSRDKKTPSALDDRLHALPHLLAEGLGRPESVQDVFASLFAITSLVGCCDISFASNEIGAAWQGVATWLANIPTHFNQMLVCHHPAALVVLAHWAAILVKRAERLGCWFLKGSAKIMMLEVARRLSANGRVVLSLVESLMGIVND